LGFKVDLTKMTNVEQVRKEFVPKVIVINIGLNYHPGRLFLGDIGQGYGIVEFEAIFFCVPELLLWPGTREIEGGIRA